MHAAREHAPTQADRRLSSCRPNRTQTPRSSGVDRRRPGMTIARCMEFRLRLRTDVSGFPCECAQATMPQLIKSYLVSYLANFAGSLLLVRVPLTAACLRRASVGHTSRRDARDAQDASTADAASVWCELRTQNSAILVVETDASRRLRGRRCSWWRRRGCSAPRAPPWAWRWPRRRSPSARRSSAACCATSSCASPSCKRPPLRTSLARRYVPPALSSPLGDSGDGWR